MLDLRLPIGWLFIILGTLLTIYGFAQPVATLIGTQPVNLNLTWGALMGVFGLCMCLLAYRDRLT